MKYLIKDINKNEKDRLEKMGLYCYDLRESDMGDEVANIEKNVFINKVGNMITNEKIEFEKSPNDFVNYFDFCMKNQQVDKIEDLLVKEKVVDTEKILNETNLSNINFTEPQFVKQREGRLKRDNSDKISVRALLNDYKKMQKRNLSAKKERGAR